MSKASTASHVSGGRARLGDDVLVPSPLALFFGLGHDLARDQKWRKA